MLLFDEIKLRGLSCNLGLRVVVKNSENSSKMEKKSPTHQTSSPLMCMSIKIGTLH